MERAAGLDQCSRSASIACAFFAGCILGGCIHSKLIVVPKSGECDLDIDTAREHVRVDVVSNFSWQVGERNGSHGYRMSLEILLM